MKTFTHPSQLGSLKLMVEDKKGFLIALCLYYQIPICTSAAELRKLFPLGVSIGVK